MGIRATIPPGATPLAAVEAIIALYGRENVELAIEALIEHLDRADGDSDLEPNGDELDGIGGAEDEFCSHWGEGGPGCPIADPGGGNILDERHDDEDVDKEPDDPAARRPHLHRIRRTACDVQEYRGFLGRVHREYRLKNWAAVRYAVDGQGGLYRCQSL